MKGNMKTLDEVYTIIEELSEFNGDNSHLLQTFGKDLKVVMKQVKKNPKKVWTIIDCGERKLYAIAGYHFVNRLNYVITEEEWKDESEEYIY